MAPYKPGLIQAYSHSKLLTDCCLASFRTANATFSISFKQLWRKKIVQAKERLPAITEPITGIKREASSTASPVATSFPNNARILATEENRVWVVRIVFWVVIHKFINILDPSTGIPSWVMYALTSLNTRRASTAKDTPGTGTAATPADIPAARNIRPLKIATFLFRIPFDKTVRLSRDKVSASLLYLGNASRIALVSRLKSHLSGWWLLIRKTKSSLLMGSPGLSTRFSLQLRRIFCNTAASLKDFFRISARTSTSIFVRMKKKDLPCFFISLANVLSYSVNRLLAKIRNVWYLSSCTFWRYVSRSG